MYGYIPEEIAIVHSGQSKVYRRWFDLDEDKQEELVIPAFPVDATNEKRMRTAVNWAERRGNTSYLERKKAIVIKRKNTPFNWLRILALDVRYGGGRAWKVVDRDGFYFDLREDVLLEIMRHYGIDKNAEINGEFIWAVVGTETKIVRIGSSMHSKLIEATKMHNSKILNSKELTPGDICQSKSGDKAVFLGWVAGKDITLHCESSWHGYLKGQQLDSYKFTSSKFKKRSLWYRVIGNDLSQLEANIISDLERNEPVRQHYWPLRFEVKKNHVFRKVIGSVKVPDDIVQQVSAVALQAANWTKEHTFNRLKGYKFSYGILQNHPNLIIANQVFNSRGRNIYNNDGPARLIWIAPIGEKIPEIRDFDDILGEYAYQI